MAEPIDLGAWMKAEVQRIKKKLENLKYVVDLDGQKPPKPDPGPERIFQTDYSTEVLITHMYEHLLASGGDPDGMPVERLAQFKAGIAEVYLGEAQRLRSEVSQLERGRAVRASA